jgi:hypothetical protein
MQRAQTWWGLLLSNLAGLAAQFASFNFLNPLIWEVGSSSACTHDAHKEIRAKVLLGLGARLAGPV